MSHSHACAVWDVTLAADAVSRNELVKSLKVLAKKWVFQLEKGEQNGYEHWQMRLSLHKKKRLPELLKLLKASGEFWDPNVTGKSMHVSVTAECNKNDFTYQTKLDTRLDGPWSSMDPEPPYIPRQVRNIQLWPWQAQVQQTFDVWDTRTINVIVCPDGNIGKSTFVTYCRAHGLARPLPPVNDHKDMMRMVCDMPTAKVYLIDIPRAFNQEKMRAMWSAIESIKDGYAYDDRYSFKEKVFDCPVIWVFMNQTPDTLTLSSDRWRFYSVKGNMLCNSKRNR